MVKEKIKISVIIRTYNSENTIGEAINSAIKQNIDSENYEIIVIDDGSTDSTLSILKEYGNRLRVIRQEHGGPVNATNKGIIKSKGVFITLLDSDDLFTKDTLKEMEQAFSDKTIDFVYCDYFEEDGNSKREVISLKENIFKTIGCGIMFKKELFSKVGLFDENFIFSEYDFLIKLIKNKIHGKHIPLPLYVYRRNEKSLTFNKKFVSKGLEQLEKVHGGIVDKIRKY